MRKKSKYLSVLYFLFLCCCIKDLSAEVDFDIYRPPTSSYHCKHLSDKRQENLKIKQQLVSLLERNSRLIKNTPKEKETTYRQLVFLRGEIKFKLEKHIFRLKSVEETLVRRGCPSILSTNS